MSTLLRHVANVERLRYLELGLGDGQHFASVPCSDKTSVDIGNPAATHFMSTDAYFAALGDGERFDIVFIDAGHEFRQVVRDYNNSVRHLRQPGLLFIHDLVPPDADWARPDGGCGDGYQLLHHLCTATDMHPWTLRRDECDFGLTLVVSPQAVSEVPPLSYDAWAAWYEREGPKHYLAALSTACWNAWPA